MQPHYDEQASVVLAFIALFTSSASLIDAALQLALRHHAKQSTTFQIIVGIIALTSGLLACAKFIISSRVRSQVLFLDACMTLSCAIVSCSYVITVSFSTKYEAETWWIDGCTALLVSFLLILYAVCVLYTIYSKVNFLAPSFWTSKRK